MLLLETKPQRRSTEFCTNHGRHLELMISPRASASVIIANYNYARFLSAAVESALAQTHEKTEVIVVDDGSTDDSRQVICSFGSRIKPVFKPNGGHGSALNAGFAASTGDAVFFLDADDTMHPNAVATVLAAWRDGTALVQYLMDVIDINGRVTGVHPPPWEPLASGNVRDRVLSTGSFATTVTSGLAFSRDVLAHVMPIPDHIFRYAPDGYLVRAVALLGPVQAVNQRLAQYRRHETNDSAPHEDDADSADLAQFFRKKIGYMKNEYDAVREAAKTLGLQVANDLGEHDAEYLSCRLLSLALDASAHPFENDRRTELLLRYLAQRWSTPEPFVRRVVDSATALGVSMLPPDAGAKLVRWRKVPSTRPHWLKQIASSYQGARALLGRSLVTSSRG